MYEIDSFRVVSPLVLHKPMADKVKTLVKNVALAFGVDLNGWKAVRQAWNQPKNVKEYAITEGELDPAKIAEIAAYAAQRVHDYIKDIGAVSDEDLKQTIQYTTIPLLDHLFQQDASLKSVMDVGCYYIRVLDILVRKYPGIVWDFVDFMDNLEEVNKPFHRANARFIQNYPLTALRQGEDRWDVVHFNRVFVLMGRDEAQSYVEVLRRKARYVVVGEATKLVADLGDLNVDAIDLYRQNPGYRTYNVKKMLENNGFDILHHDAVMTSARFSGAQHFIIRTVARNRELANG